MTYVIFYELRHTFYTLYTLAYYYLFYYLVDVCIFICGKLKLIDTGTTFEKIANDVKTAWIHW